MSLSTFAGFEVARSGLNTSQTALNVVNHNISGAGVNGYSRQEALQAANRPYTVPGLRTPVSAGQLGTGVTVEQIKRYRDQFADLQYRKENQFYGEAEAKQTFLSQIETAYNEPSNTAIRANLDAFWQGLQTLADNAESTANRTSLKEIALKLTDSVNAVAKQLEVLWQDADDEISNNVKDVNSLLIDICSLNKSIVQVEVTGQNANDYRDARDNLLDELSKKINMQYEEQEDGSVNVYIAGKLAVSGTSCSEIRIVKETVEDDDFDGLFTGQKINKLVWADMGEEVDITSGTLKGLKDIRDEMIPDYLNQLDNLMNTLAAEINKLHKEGFGLNENTKSNRDFFTSSDTSGTAVVGKPHFAKYITVNPDICNDVSKIAASSDPTVLIDGSTKEANNVVAKQMADVCKKKCGIPPGSAVAHTTLNDYYQSSMTKLGTDSDKVSATLANKEILLNGILDRRDSVSGVNEDDEMINMLKFQRTYSSSARIITAYDEMLQTILNMGA